LFTIKQAAQVVGVPEPTLRTWERRYGVVAPERSATGYRVYDARAIATLTAMRRLVDAGWSPSNAATTLLEGGVPAASAQHGADPHDEFLEGARRMDPHTTHRALDRGFALGSFEHVVDTWLSPAMAALGEGWASGDIDVAGEHVASHLVLRRLSAALEAAGTRNRGPKVVVGLPAGSLHELGALAFATASRRIGLDVLYLGADVPERSWLAAVDSHRADAAVLSVATAADRSSGRATARRLGEQHPKLLVAVGGPSAHGLSPEVHELPPSIAAAAQQLDALLHPVLTG
jgi:methanogenic corrinoid protein MtbC1